MTDEAGYVDDRMAYPHISGLGDALLPELTARLLPGLCEVMHGAGAALAFDACSTECEGMAWVRLAGAYASSSDFPNADASPVRGRMLMAETFELGLVRGVELPRKAEDGMDPAVIAAAGRMQLADMSALLAVICAYFGGKGIPYIIGQYTPYGIQGGCLGGWWTVTAWTGAAPKARA